MEITEKEVIDMLSDVVKILDKNEVHFWLGDGALLGWYRDGHLIPWDKDVDLHMTFDERDKIPKLIKQFKEKGFKLKFKTRSFIIKKNGMTFSIAVWMKGDKFFNTGLAITLGHEQVKFRKRLWMYGLLFPLSAPTTTSNPMSRLPLFIKKWLYEKLFVIGIKHIGLYIRKYTVPYTFYADLKTVDFIGVKLKIPRDVEGYLKYYYGENWRTPDKQYHHDKFASFRTNYDVPYEKGMEKYDVRYELSLYKKEDAKERLIVLLKDFKEILDKNNISFWLCEGTLLGAIRDGKIIEWDDDIDIGTWKDDNVDLNPMMDELYNKGYDVYLADTKIQIKKDDLHLSLWLFEKKGDFIIRKSYRHVKHLKIGNVLTYLLLAGLTTIGEDRIHKKTIKVSIVNYIKRKLMMLKPSIKKLLIALIVEVAKKINCLDCFVLKIPAQFIGDLKQIEYYGMMVCIPELNEEYLEYVYGDWKVPDSSWTTESHSKKMKEHKEEKKCIM